MTVGARNIHFLAEIGGHGWTEFLNEISHSSFRKSKLSCIFTEI